MVGRSPGTAADAPVGLLAPCKMLIALYRLRDGGVPRRPGGLPHNFRSTRHWAEAPAPPCIRRPSTIPVPVEQPRRRPGRCPVVARADRKSTRLNSSHLVISY